jgi:hypothetical protein
MIGVDPQGAQAVVDSLAGAEPENPAVWMGKAMVAEEFRDVAAARRNYLRAAEAARAAGDAERRIRAEGSLARLGGAGDTLPR